MAGTVTFTLISGNPNFPRNYVVGINVGAVVHSVQFVTNVLTFVVDPFYVWDLTVRPEVFSPSSNVYSLDHVFDLDNCNFYVNGVPTPNILTMRLGYVTDERELKILIASEFGFDPDNTAYWQVPNVPWPPHDFP